MPAKPLCPAAGLYREDAVTGVYPGLKSALPVSAARIQPLRRSERLAMSCLDVMYHHQTYGAHQYLPATSAAAAVVAYKAAYYHHQHQHQQQQQQQQQKKLCVYSKMQDSLDAVGKQAQQQETAQQQQQQEAEAEEEGGRAGGLVKEPQPAETEYLSSRCVLFTYFQGDIGDVVDEHFSRALSQPSGFSASPAKTPRPVGSALWKESVPDGGQCAFPASFWSSAYPSQSGACLPAVHPEFPANAAFHPPDAGAWGGHGLHQSGLAPPPTMSDSWHYSLGASTSPSYPHVHEVYSHIHPRHPHAHPHPMLHPHAHGSALDPRYSPLLLPSVRPSCAPGPHCDVTKAEPDLAPGHGQPWTAAFHGAVDIAYDNALDQDKAKTSVWF
ncbi:transcription cofactor vestigial-like protein 3 [Amia ocellicauda]|uniref:transcription cofactor vestigial-like protein 3 n=1 Tax=Amia ocellicauda TaxID=2972642 RepID=UPI003463AE3B